MSAKQSMASSEQIAGLIIRRKRGRERVTSKKERKEKVSVEGSKEGTKSPQSLTVSESADTHK